MLCKNKRYLRSVEMLTTCNKAQKALLQASWQPAENLNFGLVMDKHLIELHAKGCRMLQYIL